MSNTPVPVIGSTPPEIVQPSLLPDDTTPEGALTRLAELGAVPIPEDTNGRYVVLWAPLPAPNADDPVPAAPAFRELVCAEAHSPQQAKRLVIGDRVEPIDARIAEWLRLAAAAGGGIVLRAVPAMHWPATTPTTLVTPAPVLTVG